MQKIFEQYKPFIIKTAKQFNIRNYEICDLMQIAYIALINVVDKYQISSNTFSSYAFKSIVNSLRHTARKSLKHNREFSLNVPVGVNEAPSADFIDFVASLDNIEEAVLSSEKAREIRQIIAKLPEEERDLVITLFYKGGSLKAFAEKRGMCYPTALRRKKSVLEKLEKNLKNSYLM
jgi:RNA polymerase sigma factor, sigma-70 family